MNSYQELEVWQQGINLTISIYKATSQFPTKEIYSLTSQMRRAAVSIPSNIAEGFDRHSTKEYIKFLRISIGSCAELETQVLIAKKLAYLDTNLYQNIYNQLNLIHKKLHALVTALEKKLS